MNDISPAQIILVTLAAFGFIIIQLFEMLYKREDWPFSCYKMFSGIRRKRRRVLHLYGAAWDGSQERELMLVDPKCLFPFDQTRLGYAFKGLLREKNSDRKILEALKDCYERYETRRQGGLHSGPYLEEVRLYWVEWEILAYAQNRYSPENRERVASWSARPVLL
jgi:hypothetical protein